MNKITKTFLTIAFLSTATQGATLISDDYSTDTSSDYTGSGFNVSGGALNVTITSSINHITLTNSFNFGIGSSVSIDVLDTRSLFELEGLTLSTDLAVSDRVTFGRGTFNGGSSHGWFFASDNGTLTPRVSGNSSPVTLRIERSALDMFELEVIQSGSTVASHTHTDATWSGVNDFYVSASGLRDTGTATVRFDNLSITSVPEPSGVILFGSSLLGGLFIRRRK